MEKIKVAVELRWGSYWNGSHFVETPGTGVYATVCEWEGRSFRGCPLGRGLIFNSDSQAEAIESSIDDFIRRGRAEYLGASPLTRDIIEIVRQDDRRR